MRFAPALTPAAFVRRLNRFAAMVSVGDRAVQAHVPNSGRLGELLVPGARCLLTAQPGQNSARRTAFDLTLVQLGTEWVCVDSRLPPRLLGEAVNRCVVRPFEDMGVAQKEVWYKDSRLDLLLEGTHGDCLVETKCVTLVERGVALFPDAPTERGRRHLATLAQAVSSSRRAAVVFFVQRRDAFAFAPNNTTDPAFGVALRRAAMEGVEVYAYRCRVAPTGTCLESTIPVLLSGQQTTGARGGSR